MTPGTTFTATEVQAALTAVILYERARAALILQAAIRQVEATR